MYIGVILQGGDAHHSQRSRLHRLCDRRLRADRQGVRGTLDARGHPAGEHSGRNAIEQGPLPLGTIGLTEQSHVGPGTARRGQRCARIDRRAGGEACAACGHQSQGQTTLERRVLERGARRCGIGARRRRGDDSQDQWSLTGPQGLLEREQTAFNGGRIERNARRTTAGRGSHDLHVAAGITHERRQRGIGGCSTAPGQAYEHDAHGLGKTGLAGGLDGNLANGRGLRRRHRCGAQEERHARQPGAGATPKQDAHGRIAYNTAPLFPHPSRP